MKKATVLLLALSIAGCASSSPATSNPAVAAPSHAAAEPEIFEAVFRYQFDHNASGIQKQAERYCLYLPGETSPDATFLHRFEGNQPPVLAADECERKSGKSLFFRINKLQWHKENEVWVRGGYFEGNLSSSVESYRVLFKNGKWAVEGARMEAIS
ncbi:MAG: hypothetical protein QOF89_1210 [Acidobacteriota bacterium]|jgi:hypothetical protein|nr:hypothetical protein [Acidobacteriota bacterium]